tara:strand:- start:394 stop:2616 length:2223 start_codon:yes stop_codon:yes gene_type:complete
MKTIMIKIGKFIATLTGIWLLSIAIIWISNSNKVAIVVTDWGQPEGFSDSYYQGIALRSRIGIKANSPSEPCTEYFVGNYPYRSSMGGNIHASSFLTDGYSEYYDSFGMYRFEESLGLYVNTLDENVTLSIDEADQYEKIKVTGSGDGYGRRNILSVDPRDGSDPLPNYYKIMKPNGIQDVREQDVAFYRRINKLLGAKKESIGMHPMTDFMDVYLTKFMDEFFGDRVAIRFGMYEKNAGYSARHDDVAWAMARWGGFRKILLTRETTDHNLYANHFMTRNKVHYRLCKSGVRENIDLRQIRQVGRTPEYNLMLVRNMERYLEMFPSSEEISIVYATYGLPWPGRNPEGPLGAPHPWIKEVYHENAFNNYLSFKRYAESYFSKKNNGNFSLNFNRNDGSGSNDSRTRSLYGYSRFPSSIFGHPEDELRFQTIRDQLKHAVSNGRKNIVIVPSHWYYNGQDTGLKIRELNGIPLNTIEEMESGIFEISWCERYKTDGSLMQILDKGVDCPDGYSRITLMEAFDEVKEQFNLGYAQRIRGGVEQFGILPNLGIEIMASGQISYLDGGTIEVKEGMLKGAKLSVRKDPHPDSPESFSYQTSYRHKNSRDPNPNLNATRPFNDFKDHDDHLISAWFDFSAMIGRQEQSHPGKVMPIMQNSISEAVYFGPYRTLFNAPATITLPINITKVESSNKLRAYIYNDLLETFEPIHTPPGGKGISINYEKKTASFDTQVLGIFVIGKEN